MPAVLIDGRQIASSLQQGLRERVREFATRHRVSPGLAVVLVGDDPASDIYVRNKVRTAASVGIKSFERRFPADIAEDRLMAEIRALDLDPEVHGILLQLPLPPGLDAQKIIECIRPSKDVDGFSETNVGRLSLGREGLVPCTPSGCMHLLRSVAPVLSGRHAVVVGRSNIVGRPMAPLLLAADCTVTTVHSRSQDVARICSTADILVVAAGVPGLVRRDWVKPGAIVIDVGIHRVESSGAQRLVGDVLLEDVAGVAGFITPVPGGVGPMTIHYLLENTLAAASRSIHEH